MVKPIMDSQRTAGFFIAPLTRLGNHRAWHNEEPDQHEMCMDALASAINIKMASQIWSKYRKPNSAAGLPANCALQQKMPRTAESKNSNRYCPDNARLVSFPDRRQSLPGQRCFQLPIRAKWC
jgi:hypothetical protein